MKNGRSAIISAVLTVAIAGGAWGQSSLARAGKGEARIQREVRHELVTLPFYGVFDNLAYKVEGPRVTLMGQVTQPVVKSDAEKAVKHIEGVEQVVNQIEVLPPSPSDDSLRRELFRVIYGTPGLDRYGLQAVPSIHIVVKNGHVALEGAVGNGMDKILVGTKANGVSGVFSVDNNLQVDRS